MGDTERAPSEGQGIRELRQLAYEHRNDGMELTAAMLDRCADRLAALSEQEPEKAFRAGVSYGVDFADAHDPADGFGGPSEEWQKAKYADWLARTHQSPEEADR